jgi:hypothetical protein
MAAGPILIEWGRERKEEARKREEEQERRRVKQRDEHRWRQFCALAMDWQERTRLLTFLAEVENPL